MRRPAVSLAFWICALILLSWQPIRAQLTVDTSIRRASRNFFNGIYRASNDAVPLWTGNVATGAAGDTADDFKQAVALRINSLRAFAGTPAAITLNPVWNVKAQKAALMMSANNQLNHTPPVSWTYYTAEGAEAAGSSNLSYNSFGPDAMTIYVEDAGSNNADAGHRRWLLFPPTQLMGTGDIPPSMGYAAINALWVFDLAHPYPALRDGFVAWPPKGYIPYQLVFPRWSFSLKDAVFSGASVSVQRNGVNVTTVIESASTTGVGDSTLVWHLTGAEDGTGPLPPPASDSTYAVTLSNVLVGGAPQSFSYSVIAFNPDKTGTDDILPTLSGPATVALGTTTNLPFSTLPEANAYDFWTADLQVAAWIEGAELPPLHLQTQTTGSYASIDLTVSAAGSRSFHLCQDGFNDQALLLTGRFVASASSSISFKSRYGYMTPTQVAVVEVSIDEGKSWSRVFSRAGNSADANAFIAQSVSLAPFANRIIQLRFLLDYLSGSAYTQTGTAFGWFIDEITPVNLLEASSVAVTSLSSSPATFTAPNQNDSVGLAMRAKLFSNYPLEYGPVKVMTVGQGVLPPPIIYRQIMLAASPKVYGSVSGAGTFVQGTVRTVKAIPKKGHTFQNWTANNVVVSKKANYSFVLTTSCALRANFK